MCIRDRHGPTPPFFSFFFFSLLRRLPSSRRTDLRVVFGVPRSNFPERYFSCFLFILFIYSRQSWLTGAHYICGETPSPFHSPPLISENPKGVWLDNYSSLSDYFATVLTSLPLKVLCALHRRRWVASLLGSGSTSARDRRCLLYTSRCV